LATTTSTRDSGLLDVLLPLFRRRTGVEVKVVAVGSGQALQLGRRGDADVLLTHAPAAERQFMADGYGSLCLPVMYNEFAIVGPEGDPAHVRAQNRAATALAQIASTQSPFVSRGDDSGTHQKERQLWRQATLDPRGSWYIQAGSGMAQSLRIASEKQAYTLTDLGTFLAERRRLQLTILLRGDPVLRNPYTVIVVNPQKHPHVAHQAARELAAFLVAPETQRVIARFGVQRFGMPLFYSSR
jgi:tungstate transport system substrate-binding protein